MTDFEGKADRDSFMDIDDIDDWLHDSDPSDIENILYGVMDYIGELERKYEWRIKGLRDDLTSEIKINRKLQEHPDISTGGQLAYKLTAEMMERILESDNRRSR